MATIDEGERDRLARALYCSVGGAESGWMAVSAHIRSNWRERIDQMLAAGWRPPEVTPKREWPVTEEAVRAYLDSQPIRPGLSNAARHLWRARVEGMTQEELIRFLYELPDANEIEAVDIRAALLALGDL